MYQVIEGVVFVKFKVAIDTGGTFTDMIAFDLETGDIITTKEYSDHSEPVKPIECGIKSLGIDLALAYSLVHGTTLTTNVLIERKGANTLLLTTKGFEDVVFIQRCNRKYLYDFKWIKPKPLVKRRNVVGVNERINYKGEPIIPLTEKDADSFLDALAGHIEDEHIEAVAISFLFSYLNPAHEELLKQLIEKRFPGLHISISSEVVPIWREYERTNTTIVDAYLKPSLNRYVKRLTQGLAEMGYKKSWAFMKSNGGMENAENTSKQPVHSVLSGPAGGFVAAKFIGDLVRKDRILTMDMGGTSCDVALIGRDREAYTTDFQVEWGMPICVPTVDIKTIGAGGGSIAWIDKGGRLNVGPQSAGASPGPACYGQGGTAPTVTDANLLLGRINPLYFRGGRDILDKRAAETAISDLAKKIDLKPLDVAEAIIELTNENMANALRLVSVEKGYDLREFTLIAYGGAGPLHASAVARRLGLPRVIIPIYPALFSAFGMLVAAPKVVKVWNRLYRSSSLTPEQLANEYARIEEEAMVELTAGGYTDGEIFWRRVIYMRYCGQNYERPVILDDEAIDDSHLKRVIARFHEEHACDYGYSFPDDDVEITGGEVSAIGRVTAPQLKRLPEGPAPAPYGFRDIYFNNGFIKCPVYRRATLPAGIRLNGPVCIEEDTSCCLVEPGQSLSVDEYGLLFIDLKAENN